MADAWAIWLVISLILLVSVGIVIWFAIDSSISDKSTNKNTLIMMS